ncbi:MAG: flagellar hook-basal body complex protein FliE [Pseudomonadota bacterium]
MTDINTAQVLAQIRDLGAPLRVNNVNQADAGQFSSLLARSVAAVNDTQQTAAAQASAFEVGAPDADLTQVMVSLQKASLSFQAMTEVRNKLVNAYQEVMNMPV